MSIGIQHFKAARKRFKGDIKRSNRKLLMAAVILFCLSWAIASPVKGIEKLILPRPNTSRNFIIENNENQEIADAQECNLNANYLMANAVASVAVNMPDDEAEESGEAYFEGDSDLTVLNESALVASANPTTLISQQPRNEIIAYTVQEGDTPSTIAASFGISLNTLLWANKLTATTIIRPGDTLDILPVTGLLHRVKNNETIGWIANHYGADTDEVIAFNDLSEDGAIQIGQKLVIPNGRMPVVVSTRSTSYTAQTSTVTGPGTGKSRAFPYGQCTWYVAQKRYVPWSGHAKAWLANAAAYGFQTGTTPQAGAIMVLTEGGWLGRVYGHVAYVESVNNGWVTISEMNYSCFACRSVRTIKATDSRIRGYIY